MREVPGSTPGQAPFFRSYFSLFFFGFICLFICFAFCFRLASNAFPDIGSVVRIEKKNKKNRKKDDVKNTQIPYAYGPGGATGAAAPPKFWTTQNFWAAGENLGKAGF